MSYSHGAYGYSSHKSDTRSGGSASQYPKIFLVTIGIDKYHDDNYSNLKGCKSDADKIEHYFKSDLRVPATSILASLRDSTATRAGITEALVYLRNNPSIEYGDAIVIYFAGHGTEYDGLDGSKVQYIVPYDYRKVDPHTRGSIQAIADYEIGSHLKEIASAKGNNITVILDNCHSGSGTRAVPDQETFYRGVSYRGPIPDVGRYDEPDSRARIGGLGATPDAVYRNGLKWHSVLLAACASGERATERGAKGMFTDVLLKTMRSISDIRRITYGELFRQLPRISDYQNPQCEGDHKDRYIFQAFVKPAPLETQRSLPSDLSTATRIEIYIDPGMDRALRGLDEFHRSKPAEGVDIVLAENRRTTPPRFQLSFDRTKRYISIDDYDMKRNFNVSTIPRSIDAMESPNTFRNIFEAMSVFEYFLDRTARLSRKISIQFFDATYNRQMGNQVINGENLYVDGKIDVVQKQDTHFTIQIDNQTSQDLYPTLFYFDSCDLSINLLYTPPTVQNINYRVDPPLKARQRMYIGYGSADLHRLCVGIRQGHDFEAGYVKLFVSNEYADLSSIVQNSPFRRMRNPHYGRPAPPRILQSIAIPFFARPARTRSTSDSYENQSRSDQDGPVFTLVGPGADQGVEKLSRGMHRMTVNHDQALPPPYQQQQRSMSDSQQQRSISSSQYRSTSSSQQRSPSGSHYRERHSDLEDAYFRIQKMGAELDSFINEVNDMQEQHSQIVATEKELALRIASMERYVGNL